MGEPRGLAQAAGALSEAHQAGLIHPDIKPANVMLCRAGGLFDVTKVLDFGLVKEIARTDATALTKADSLTGTPQYMAPEAITSPDSIDHRVDLYALRTLAYYLVTGEHVFNGRSLVEICSQHLHADPLPPSDRLGAPVDADLEALIMNLLDKNRDVRPSSARDVLRKLESCREHGKWTQTRGGRVVDLARDAAVRSASLPVSETIDIALEGRHLARTGLTIGSEARCALARPARTSVCPRALRLSPVTHRSGPSSRLAVRFG